MKIFVISHKNFTMPVESPLYCGLMVGGNCGEEHWYLRDNTGDQISDKNRIYNELTGVYWIWQNVQENIVGICHYRRLFVTPAGKVFNLLFHKQNNFLKEHCIVKILSKYDMVVHNKTYFTKSNREQFCESLPSAYLAAAETVIASVCPEYLESYRIVMDRKYAHLLNMCIAKKEVFDEYCQWLFSILFQTEEYLQKNTPELKLDRSLGMIGERLLDVWILQNQIRIKECFTVNTERIDWKVW